MKFSRLLAVAAIAALPTLAHAQSNPNLTKGQVPTAGQWNSYFSAKQDVLGYVPLNIAGGAMSGRLVTAPPGATIAGFNLGPGTAPGSPINGDLWITPTGFFAQVGGVTIGPIAGPSSGSFAATSPLSVSFPGNITTYACSTCGVTTSPLSQFASTTSAQLAGVLSDETGSGLAVFNNAPTLIAPVLGAATATSINKVAITAPATSATLTIANSKTLTASNSITLAGTDGKTLTVNNSLTFTGTDGTSFALPATSDTVVTLAAAQTLAAKTLTNPIISGASPASAGAIGYTAGLINWYDGAAIRSAVAADTTQTLTNKTLTSSTNVLGGVTMTLGADATGDIYYRNSGGQLTRLAVGSNTNVLTVSGGLPTWQPGSSSASVTVGTTAVNSATSGSVLYSSAGTLTNAPIASFLIAGTNTTISGTSNATIGQTSGVRLLETLTPSSASSAATSVSWSGCTSIEFVIRNLTTSAGIPAVQVNVGGVQTTVYVAGSGYINTATPSNWGTGLSSTTALVLAPLNVTSTDGLSGVYTLLNVASTTLRKNFNGQGTLFQSGAAYWINAYGVWNGGAGAVTGAQFLSTSGTITGTIDVRCIY